VEATYEYNGKPPIEEMNVIDLGMYRSSSAEPESRLNQQLRGIKDVLEGIRTELRRIASDEITRLRG
jgi:hypothetical protein